MTGKSNSSFGAIFRNYTFFQIFIMGIISGMPFAILYTSIIAWLTEDGMNIAIVTSFALARLPYSLKFIWAPFMDNFKLPVLYNLLGRRRSWMIVTSISISIILLVMSRISSPHNAPYLKLLSIVLGFFAATYDIAYDAMRIEMLNDNEQAMGAVITGYGFRTGALITGAGALYLADKTNWSTTFFSMGLIFAAGVLFILSVRVFSEVPGKNNKFNWETWHRVIIQPFQDLFSRPKFSIILIAIMSYKLGDAMLSFSGIPFYLALGFTKGQIATIVKIFGLIATLIGSYVGGTICIRLGGFNGLIICGVTQMLTNLLYIWLHHQPIYPVFAIANFCENFTGGMGAAALVGYLSGLCNKKFAATHYALLSSTATFMNNSLTATTGTLVNYLGWDYFFMFTVLISIPSLALLMYIKRTLEPG